MSATRRAVSVIGTRRWRELLDVARWSPHPANKGARAYECGNQATGVVHAFELAQQANGHVVAAFGCCHRVSKYSRLGVGEDIVRQVAELDVLPGRPIAHAGDKRQRMSR
jgi:hypothetical protein